MNKILKSWFGGKELAFSFGLPLGISRGTAALNSSISPTLVNDGYEIYIPMFIGTTICLISEISGFIYIVFERKINKKEENN